MLVNTTSPEYDFEITNQDFAWIGSLVTLGAANICLIIGVIMQLLGRKLTMLLIVIPFTMGWILVMFAENLTMLNLGRFLLGISGGGFCVAVPTYTGEIAQASIRGTLGTYFQLMLVMGVLFPYVLGSHMTVFTLNLICACIPIIFGMIFMFMPETPLFLISKGKQEAAIESLKWLRGKNYDYSHELAELQAQHGAEQKNKKSFVAALKRSSTIKAIFISSGLHFFQQMSGINAVIFYTQEIFDAADSGIESSIATIIVGSMQVISVFGSSIIVDKLGRRLLLLPSAFAMALSTVALGIFFYMKESNNSSVAYLGWLPTISLCVYIIFFSFGFGKF